MSDTIIRVENLGKKYIIGHQTETSSRYVALRDVIADTAKSLWNRIKNPKAKIANNSEEFWALKDVSFEIKQGEAVGIIGRNGAGKSTLLKILSRITEPTTGRISIKGRVASLLEVGTGFHPELTGRENIYLNGAILGMSKVEIKRKFDEIVAFAEIEKFLDTPVKRYSSGMYVRLAFAVAAHLEPEILVVDEVLAVGDAQFQKKCLGKMGDVATKEGRTVLFVSHNMAAIENLCASAILLEGGCLASTGHVSVVVKSYLSQSLTKNTQVTKKSGPAKLFLSILSDKSLENNFVKSGEKLTFVAEIAVEIPINKAGFGIGITTITGERIVTFHSHYQVERQWKINPTCKCIIEWNENFLCPQTYLLIAALYDGNELVASWENVGELNVISSDYFGTGKLPETSHQGYILAKANWIIN